MPVVLKRILIVVVIAALAFGGWKLMAERKEERLKKAAPVAATVSVTVAKRQDVAQMVNIVGTVVPFQSVSVRSRLDSQVLEVKFKDGDIVKKGDVLFVLDDRSLKAQQVQLQANLQRDKAQLENLQRQFERTQKLSERGYAATSTRDDAKAAMDVAKAAVGADEAALENIRVQLGYTVITSPIDGRTGTINITAGNNVRANDAQPMVTINQIQPILAQASLPQINFDAVRSAMTQGAVSVSAMREGEGAVATGTLQYIDNAVDQGTGTFVTRAVFENADEHLWPGMLVTLAIKVGEDRQALVVPEVAVQHGQQGDYLYVVADGKLQKRNVKINRIESGTALVADGVKDGEIVATDGFMNLKDGSSVTVRSKP